MMTNLMTQQTGRPLVHGGKIKQIIDDGAFDIIWHNNTSLVGGPGLLDYGSALKIYEAHEHWLVCPMHVLWKENKATVRDARVSESVRSPTSDRRNCGAIPAFWNASSSKLICSSPRANSRGKSTSNLVSRKT